jgi:hypothetical protein
MQGGILAACEVSVEALNRAEGLHDVITQVKSGQVQVIQQKYRPQIGWVTDLMWAKIKGAVTQQEWLYALFKQEFGNNEDQFFAFCRRDQRHGDCEDSLQAFQQVVQAIPHMERELTAEKQKSTYLDDSGTFSEAVWERT